MEEHEYVLTWYFCQLKVQEEEKVYACKDADGFPDCTTCEYQIKINAEREKSFAECEAYNSLPNRERR